MEYKKRLMMILFGVICVLLLTVGKGIEGAADILSTQTKIAFSTDEGIYVANIDGTNKIKVSSYFDPEVDRGLTYFPCVTWSPDGQQLAFRYYKSVSMKDVPAWWPRDLSRNGAESYICIVSIDNSKIHMLLSGDYPSWSPDGKKLVFFAHDDSTDSDHLYLVGLDGTGKIEVGPPVTSVPRGGSPVWSPDGRKIAYVDSGDICMIEADGSNKTCLINNGDDPAWSPDGKHIAFSKEEDDNRNIYVMNVNGKNQKRLTANKGNNSNPSWSPDGNKIIFTSDKDGHHALYVMDSDGARQTRLEGTEDAYCPSWSPFIK